MVDCMFPKAVVQAVYVLVLALIVVVIAAPEATAHPVPHPGEAVAAGSKDMADAAVDAFACCHAVSGCSVALSADPVGILSKQSWSRIGRRLAAGASHASLAGGADPPPPRG